MLSAILEKIEDRLETVPGLTVLYDVRQADKAKAPLAVINFDSQSPIGDNWKHSSKYKVGLTITIDLVHTALLDLLDLIESVESSLKISEKIERNHRLGLSRLE